MTTTLRLTIEQRGDNGLVDEEFVDMEAPADLVAYISDDDGAEQERGREHYATGREASRALSEMVKRKMR